MIVKFYLCEDIRQEINGKVMLIGLYPDDTLVFNTPETTLINQKEVALVFIPKLQILLNISDFEGDVEVSGYFMQPGNAAQTPLNSLGKAAIPKGKSHNFILDISNFPAVGPGTYTFLAKVNEEEYLFPIHIIYEE